MRKKCLARMPRALATLSTLLLAAAQPANAQSEIAGVKLPDSVDVGAETLALVSCGVRGTLWTVRARISRP